MNNLFSQLNGFDKKYTEVNSTKYKEEVEENVDYSAVDFCIGNTDKVAAEGSIFDTDNNYGDIDDNYSIFE